MPRAIVIPALLALLVIAADAQQQSQPPVPSSQQPARDTPAETQAAAPTPAGRITGRVVAGDTSRPVKRARVFISAAELPGGRGMLTDDSGVFDFTELPAGRYSVSVSKSGFVSLSYGQRRPLQAGTPLQLADNQQLKGIDFQLPRGSVIGGHVMDEDGDVMPGVTIRVMRYQYQQGDRRLAPAGSGQTDDKGQYRVWGLMPGDYYVNATARAGPGQGGFGGVGGGRGGPLGPGGRGARGGSGAGGGSASEPDQLNYAPTYYPGVVTLNDAKPIALGLSEEALDVNFSMQLVPMSRLTGRVTNPDGTPVTSGNVDLITDSNGRGNQLGANFGGRIQWDGAFTIASVPPGRYTLRARGDDADTPQYAALPISLNGTDLTDLLVILTAGARLSGTVTFEPGATPPPDPSQFRITAPSTDQGATGPQPNARLDKDGKFILEGVPAGTHLIRPGGSSRGWYLRSVTVGSRDVIDTPIELRSGEAISNIAIVFTDKISEINGTVTTEQGAPVPDFTVLAFPTDASLWRPQARQIMTARPDQTGLYKMRGLPPGDYYLVAVDPAEQGEWFDPAYLDEHRAGAQHVALGEGDVKTQDLRVVLR
jgi:hypothetical protein